MKRTLTPVSPSTNSRTQVNVASSSNVVTWWGEITSEWHPFEGMIRATCLSCPEARKSYECRRQRFWRRLARQTQSASARNPRKSLPTNTSEMSTTHRPSGMRSRRASLRWQLVGEGMRNLPCRVRFFTCSKARRTIYDHTQPRHVTYGPSATNETVNCRQLWRNRGTLWVHVTQVSMWNEMREMQVCMIHQWLWFIMMHRYFKVWTYTLFTLINFSRSRIIRIAKING